jgi:hypothetical protein
MAVCTFQFEEMRMGIIILSSVAEPHHFYAAPGKNFDAAPAAPALTLLYSKGKILK